MRPQRAHGPPPWEPALGLGFSHLHVRLGARGSLHPGVGPPLAIWNDFMARWPDPRERRNSPALLPPPRVYAAFSTRGAPSGRASAADTLRCVR